MIDQDEDVKAALTAFVNLFVAQKWDPVWNKRVEVLTATYRAHRQRIEELELACVGLQAKIADQGRDLAALREALATVTPMFEKIIMSCGPFAEDIQVLQMCIAALAPHPSKEKVK
mgnify:FL=1